MKKIYIALGFAAMSFTACEPDLRSESPIANGLDFTNYIAIGNSLTAGYADNSLYRSGQVNSYPAILAQQFSIFGKIVFKQPLLPGETGWPAGKLVLGHTTTCEGVATIAPYSFNGARDTSGSAASIALGGPYNNMGVPGIRAVDYLTPAYAYGAAFSGAPWALRFFANPLTRPLDQVKGRPVTFFTIWLGSNDVLGYALSGGEGSPTIGSPSNISDVTAFRNAYDSVVQAMTANGAKGALINIPDVTSIPFFTTIPANGLQLDATEAAGLNAAYANVPNMSFAAGANYFVVEDPNTPFGFRQAKAGELPLLSLPQDSLRCGGWGSLKPIPKRFFLSETEVSAIRTATNEFNGFIADEAIVYGLALVNMNVYLKNFASGIRYNGVDYSPAFVTGGAFSLDGVHLTPRGYALAANEIIRSINSFYKSTIPMADPGKYDGVKFP